MDKQKHKEPGLIVDELVSVTPDIQVCFPPPLFTEPVAEPVDAEEEKYKFLSIKEWLREKKGKIISRYADKTINPDYYGKISIGVSSRKFGE